jgi:hypothetical protein
VLLSFPDDLTAGEILGEGVKGTAVQRIRDFKITVFTWGDNEPKGEIPTDYFKEGRYFDGKA